MKESIIKRSKMRAMIAYILLPILLLSSCNSLTPKTSDNSGNTNTTLTIAAAASLQNVLVEIKNNFEQTYPNINIQLNFGASGTLQKQIEQGSPTDVFISASKHHMNRLIQSGFITADQHQDLLYNELVVIAHHAEENSWATLDILASPHIERIAMGAPESVPAGMYAEQALKRLNLWNGIKDKAVFTEDSWQTLNYVDNGKVDAGIVYRTDALTAKHAKVVRSVNPDFHEPIVYSIGITQQTRNLKAAEQWMAFIQQPESQQIFKRYGFKPVNE